MSNPKGQHFVPDQSYLVQFTDPTNPPYVWVFSKDGKTKKPLVPKSILKVNHLYTLETPDKKKDFTLESALTDIEGAYATVFREKIKKHLPLTQSEHEALCVFIAALMFRTLRYKEHIEEFIGQTINMVEAMEKQHGTSTKKSDEFKEYRKNIHKLNLMQMIPVVSKILQEMNLAFICPKGSATFITSDDPCNMFNPDLQWQRFYGPGFGQKNIQLTAPLSPKITACFTWNPLRGYMEIKNKEVEELNRLTRGFCHKEFIHSSPKKKLVWFSNFPFDLKFLLLALRRKLGLYKSKK